MSRGSHDHWLLAACVLLIAIGVGVLGSVGTAPVPRATVHDGDLAPSLELGPSDPLADDDADGVPARSAKGSTAREPVQAEVHNLGDPSATSPRAVRISRLGQGRVRVRALDARTGEPLDRVRVRAASSTRIADRVSDSGHGDLELCLTPDTYALIVMSRGYEPFELQPLQIELGAALELDPVRLTAASSRIAGWVTGDRSPERGLHVELVGKGRSPCANCADPEAFAQPSTLKRDRAWARTEPCTSCGFAAQASRLALPPEGVFAFDNLAAGAYALRLVDAQDHWIGLPLHCELRRDEARVLELNAVALRSVLVELVDTDGASLAEEWAKRVRGRESIGDDRIPTEESASMPVFSCLFRADDVRVASSALIVPRPLNGPPHGTSFSSRVSHSSRGTRVSARIAVDDRPRAESETLHMKAIRPTLEPFVARSSIDAAGRVRFESLPALALTLEVSCGPFSATALIPSSNESPSLRVQLVSHAGPEDVGSNGRALDTFLRYESARDP